MSGTPSDIVDETGTVLRLGNILGQGGEGAVWDIPTMPTMVAKVYHKPLTPDRAEKIRVMSRIGTPALWEQIGGLHGVIRWFKFI